MMPATIFVAFKHKDNTVKVIFKDPLSRRGKENGLQGELVKGEDRMNKFFTSAQC